MTGIKQNWVGGFFESLAHSLVGGERIRDYCGDVCLWEHETLIEVKSSGDQSSYGFRLRLSQIDEYRVIEDAGWPCRRVWYGFFSYQNGRLPTTDGSRRTMLSSHLTPGAVAKYLSQWSEWGLVTSFSVVKRWQETVRHSSMSILGHPGMKTVDIHYKRIKPLVNGGARESLESLGLDSGAYRILTAPVSVSVSLPCGVYQTRFPVTLLLTKSEMEIARVALGSRVAGRASRL